MNYTLKFSAEFGEGKMAESCINMLSLMDICFEHDGKTNFRVVDAITVNSVCKLRTFTSCETTHTAKGVTPEVAFANGVDSTYKPATINIIDRRPMHEEWIEVAAVFRR